MPIQNKRSFTLMEIMVTILLVSTIAVLAITTYTRTMRVAYMDEAIRQLTLVHGANQAFKAKNWVYWPNDGVAHTLITEINTVLKLELPNINYNFSCFGVGGVNWNCTATYRGTPAFEVTVDQAAISAANPRCTAACP